VPVPGAKEIPAGKYLCALHSGGYTEIWQHVLALRDEYKNLGLEDWSVHFNIIDQFIEKNPDHYLTKIQILLKA
jgi:effector-binding domain-containing protein